MSLSRRQLLAAAATAPLTLRAAPAATVAVARCRSYDRNLEGALKTMFDQIGGLEPLVKNKTVALKLNLTGNPMRFPLDPKLPYRTEPGTVHAVVHLMARAGAKRIRILETFFPARQEMELWDRYGLDIKGIENAGAI